MVASPQELTRWGNVLRRRGDLRGAIDCYLRVIELRPDFAGGHHNLANALAEMGQWSTAEACYRQSIALQPYEPLVHMHLGDALRAQGRLVEAVDCYRRAIVLRPDDAAAHINLGVTMLQQSLPQDAADCFRTAIRLQPDLPEAHNNMGIALRDLDQPDDAETCFRRALALRPDFAQALNNLGNTLRDQGKIAAALECLRKAVELRPDMASARNSLGLALLANGDMTEGWLEHEWRWQTPALASARPGFAQPQWRGEDAAGKTLLIHAEQGLGDTLQFCRYAPLAAARGLRVVLRVQAPLVRLLRGLPGVDAVLAEDEALPDFDLHCPMLSLPLAFTTTLASIPAPESYLGADPADAAIWHTRLGGLWRAGLGGTWQGRMVATKGPWIGLAWAGAPTQKADRRRSLAPDRLMPLFEVPGLHFVSLQKARPGAPAWMPLSWMPMVDFMSDMQDFADTAALVANLDLVIAVDTAVAHLAASMGKPVWLLDRFDSCWRWMSGRHDSPWYPSLRLYRQRRPGDWDDVVSAVASDLRAFSASSREDTEA